MAVEIRELVIRAVVGKEPAQIGPEEAAVKHSNETESIVEECVRQVLRILRKQEER